jgi:type IV pilus assembly protein PilA
MHSNQKSARPLKVRRCGGFTLIEMLIVVAIIAILVAVAIPVVTVALEKTKVATDKANERSAKAVATIAYLTDRTTGVYYFNTESGELVALDDYENANVCGKCSDHKDMYLMVSIQEGGKSHAANDAGKDKLDGTEESITIYWLDPTDPDPVDTHASDDT